jgi:ligand-binding SRPBCC domain-containing protein
MIGVPIMRHNFVAEQWVPYPAELVFDFFANPQNLPPLLPRQQKARIEEAKIVAPPPRPALQATRQLRSVVAGAGSTITISFKPFRFSPVRVRWEATISEFVWNDHFCDEQVRGPFAFWKHCHRFRPEIRDKTRGTLIIDDIAYEMKMGPVGALAHWAFVDGQMKRTFANRQTQAARFLAVVAKVGQK